VFALAESPRQKGLIWAGSDDGLVHVTADGGGTWANVTANVPDLPDWGTVACIEPSPFDADAAYLVVDNHRMNDDRPYLWKTTDRGKSWMQLTTGMADDAPLHVVRADPAKKGMLYAGSERGVLVSADDGTSWKPLRLNLPTVAVHDLVVKGDDLVVGTHGRSLWVLDDLTPVREWAAMAKPAHLFPPRPATRWRLDGGGGVGRFGTPVGANPPAGAVVWFHLATAPKAATIEVLDAAGTVVAKATGKPADAKEVIDEDDPPPGKRFTYKSGLNRFVWDVTHDGAEPIRGAKVDAGDPSQGIPAPPGAYTVRVTADMQVLTAPLFVRPDPRQDPKLPYAEQTAFALQVRDRITKLSRTVDDVRLLQKQLVLRAELLKNNDGAKQLAADSLAFAKKLTVLEEKLHNSNAKVVYDIFAARGGAMLYSQLVWLLSNSTDGDGPPTRAMREYATETAKTLAGLVAEYDTLTGPELTKLNEMATELGVPVLYVKKR
jgi:hypothetical protein